MPGSRTHEPAWYLAYGSNLHHERFTCYVAGGRPADAARTYVGCRVTTVPERWEPMTVPGRLLFAGESAVWGGGVAVYDPDGDGEVAGRAYLLTHAQLGDVVAQETRQAPGSVEDLASGVTGGSGLYDTVVALPQVEGHPVYTLGARERPAPAAPAPAYLRRVVHGLHETFGWGPERCADYLGDAVGVSPTWTRSALLALHPEGTETTT
jgi:hypothetical protein